MSTQASTTALPRSPRTPPLQNGDRLTGEEFERRFDATPGLKKAELIDGVVYMPPPVSDDDHGRPHFKVITWLGVYEASTPGVVGGDNSTLRLGPINRPQPDGYLRILPSHGGRATTDADGYVVGGPDLIAEVAASSASYDLNAKLDVYRRNNVREYVVWRVFDFAIDWFVLREGQFHPHARGPDGLFRSVIFPGLWLDPDALLRGDLATVLKRAAEGTTSQEHAAFVQRLHAAGNASAMLDS